MRGKPLMKAVDEAEWIEPMDAVRSVRKACRLTSADAKLKILKWLATGRLASVTKVAVTELDVYSVPKTPPGEASPMVMSIRTSEQAKQFLAAGFWASKFGPMHDSKRHMWKRATFAMFYRPETTVGFRDKHDPTTAFVKPRIRMVAYGVKLRSDQIRELIDETRNSKKGDNRKRTPGRSRYDWNPILDVLKEKAERGALSTEFGDFNLLGSQTKLINWVQDQFDDAIGMSPDSSNIRKKIKSLVLLDQARSQPS